MDKNAKRQKHLATKHPGGMIKIKKQPDINAGRYCKENI